MPEVHRKIYELIHDHLQTVSKDLEWTVADVAEKMADHMSRRTNLPVCTIAKGLD